MAKRKDAPRYGLMQSRARYRAREFLDFDYLKSLSEDDLDWLNRFATEYYRADFTKPGKALHRTKAAQRDCYGQDNARRRDLWNQRNRIAFDDLDSPEPEQSESADE